MEVEYKISEFKKRVDEFIKLGDSRLAYFEDPDRFLSLWEDASLYYKSIKKNAGVLSDDLLKAQQILLNAKISNPSMEKWLNNIVQPGIDPVYSKKEEFFMPTSITKPLEELIKQVGGLEFLRPERIDSIENEIKYYAGELVAHKIYYGERYYQQLLINIDAALNRLAGFKSQLHNDDFLGR